MTERKYYEFMEEITANVLKGVFDTVICSFMTKTGSVKLIGRLKVEGYGSWSYTFLVIRGLEVVFESSQLSSACTAYDSWKSEVDRND